MLATALPALSHRDRSVLRAVAAGRCGQFAGLRLLEAGLITSAPGAVALTDSGRALLVA